MLHNIGWGSVGGVGGVGRGKVGKVHTNPP